MANRSSREISTRQKLRDRISESLKEIRYVEDRVGKDIVDEECKAAWYIRHHGDDGGSASRIFMLNWCKETLQEMSNRLKNIKRGLPRSVRESSLMFTLRRANHRQERKHR
jgi:hypothetical protein